MKSGDKVKFVKCNKKEFDNLLIKDDSTIYFIFPDSEIEYKENDENNDNNN